MLRKKRSFLVEWHARSKSFTTALNGMLFVVEYGPLSDRLGREASIEEYGEYIGKSLSQAYRRQAAFRACNEKQDVMSVWEAVKPALMASNFKGEGARARAIYCLSLVPTWSVP